MGNPEEQTDDRVHVTETGARHIAVALDKAKQGFDAYQILKMTAKNLGLTVAGNVGDRVSFNPMNHEDTQGGLLRGDLVEIIEAGWMIRCESVVKAKVTKAI